jgi:hypothetical protein
MRFIRLWRLSSTCSTATMINIAYTCTSPYSKFSNDVYNLVEQPQRVFLSMYDELPETDTICYPDLHSPVPVISGKVRLSINDTFINEEQIFSLELTDPTWKDLLEEVNSMLKNCTVPIGFLENIVPLDAGTYQLIFSR